MKRDLADALALFRFEPEPIIAGGCAGTRDDGVWFRDKMRGILSRVRPHAVIETSIAKSTGGKTVDGNAQERVAFKMLRHARIGVATEMIVAFNSVFIEKGSPVLNELLQQAEWLNRVSGKRFTLLATEEDYRRIMGQKVTEPAWGLR